MSQNVCELPPRAPGHAHRRPVFPEVEAEPLPSPVAGVLWLLGPEAYTKGHF